MFTNASVGAHERGEKEGEQEGEEEEAQEEGTLGPQTLWECHVLSARRQR